MLQSNNRNAPVLLITFKRPDNTEKLINILIENKINKIFIYNNGPRNEDDNLECSKTKKIIQSYSKQYNNIEVLYKEKNTGLKSKEKFLMQSIVSIIFIFFAYKKT